MGAGSALTDSDLVRLARRGDAAALGALLERHRACLYALALGLLRDRHAAQDAVQDGFLVALRRLDDLRQPDAAGGWLRAIVRNACLMRLRHTREVPGEVPDHPGETNREPSEVVERLALRDWMLSSLDQLPDDQRATVLLRYFGSRTSYAEISAVLGVPIGTVRSRLHDAKRRLGDALLENATVHADHRALTRRRWHEWTDSIDAMEHDGHASAYFAACAPDVVVDNPGAGQRTRGTDAERRNVEAGLGVGVRLRPQSIVATTGMTILEAAYDNPPDHPEHCPPHHTEIRVHPRGRTSRLILYFGS